MATLEELGQRLETTEDLQSIVRTMKALAAVSIRQYEKAADALADYDRTVELGLIAVVAAGGLRGAGPRHAGGAGTGAAALVAVGSDHGLCGRFNEQAADRAAERHAELMKGAAASVPILAVGARIAARLEAMDLPPADFLMLPGSAGGLAEAVTDILLVLDRWQRDRGVARVDLVHNERGDEAPARPSVRRLLPLDPRDLARSAGQARPRRRIWPGRGQPMLGTDPQRLLTHLLRQRLFVVLNRALAESAAAEQAARLSSMQAAERNIADHLEELRSDFRSTRQSSITAELMDVVGGAEALARQGR